MGLFGSRKKIVVSSTVYNMAGPEEDRPNYLKSSIFSAVMSPHEKYLGETVVTNYLTGPGIKQRSFHNYAKNRDLAGLPSFSVTNSSAVDPEAIEPHIPVPATPAGLITVVQQASINMGDFTVFAEKHITETDYPKLATEWVSEYNLADHTITIQYEDGSTEVIDAGVYSSNKTFLVAYYYQELAAEKQPVVQGTKVTGLTSKPTPGAGYVFHGQTNTGNVTYTARPKRTTSKSYSDGRPSTESVDYPTLTRNFNGILDEHRKTTYEGGNGKTTQTTSREHFFFVWERLGIWQTVTSSTQYNTLADGTTETVTTTLDGDHFRTEYDHRTDTQDTLNNKTVGGFKIFIYEVGSGNAQLDALVDEAPDDSGPEFMPFIPLRLNNFSLFRNRYKEPPLGNGLYPESVKAYRRASNGQSLSKLIEEVEDNPDLEEIDYAYVQWGVALNVQEKACRKYIYHFLKGMIPYQNTSASYLAEYKDLVADYEQKKQELEEWTEAQGDVLHPKFGTPRPEVPNLVEPSTTTIRLRTTDPRLDDWDTRISWLTIHETLENGLGKTGAKVGDVWFEKGESFIWQTTQGMWTAGGGTSFLFFNIVETVRLYWQQTDDTYTYLTVSGLIYENYIYKGKAVRVTAVEAIEDTDPSGFLLPLHMPTVRSMSLVDATQMATANTFIVFNSYKVYKKKWYQTFLGMLLIIIVVVVAAAIIAPATVGGISGAFGTNAAVGGALGYSGTAAVVAGAVANAIAAIVISTVVSSVSTAIFGEKWGAIIASIVGFAVSFGMGGGFSNFSLSSLFTPQNILGMTSALANGYSGFVQANIAEIQAEMTSNAAKHEDAMSELEKMMRELGAGNDLAFDPLQLTDVDAGNGQGGSYVPETLDEFIHRTTMTGSDIVDVTLSLIGNYADLNLELPTP